MVYKIVPTHSFQKNFNNLQKQEKKQLKQKLILLSENPYHPSLRTKRIQGKSNLFECSVNMDVRVIWFYENNKIIVLLNVGHHDILKQF